MIKILSSCPVGQSCGGNDYTWLYVGIAGALFIIVVIIFIISREKK